MQLPLFMEFDGYSPKYYFFKNSLLDKFHNSIPRDGFSRVFRADDQGEVPASLVPSACLCSCF